VLGLFEVASFKELAEILADPRLEGFDEDGVSRFHRALVHGLFERDQLPADVLLRYDENIVRHWRTVTERRAHAGEPLHPKYFQYLALLFTEIYLDRWFRDPDALLRALNEQVRAFNAEISRADRLDPYTPDQLRKIAFWMATGSGKTLLMHANILQFQHYLEQHGRAKELNRVILLTPNEGLSAQHLEEFRRSGVEADIFSKDAGALFAGRAVEILEVTKLREEMGDKTVAVDAFEGNNLVLVDEGHRGAGGNTWMAMRARLAENGFSFEYSATFGQAMKAAKDPALEQEYAKSILFDYSYRYFYADGYGKDYRILNLEEDRNEVRQMYLTAALLSFYQQLRLFRDRADALRPFLLDKPLLVLVGARVTKSLSTQEASDIVEVLLFLARAVRDRARTIAYLERLLSGNAGLLDGAGRELFANSFPYLASQQSTAEQVYEDLLRTVFNAPAGGAFHVDLLKGADGEIALRLGAENPDFGVINVGDAPKLAKLCEEHPELTVGERDFAGSLFREINAPTSSVNMLLGSKKFTEGWNSWRVSSMGLMNVGRKEGSEVIQLFGRGVRLRGYDFSLKRTAHAPGIVRRAHKRALEHIRLLETLNIFGVRADYMQNFRQFLEDEGLPGNEDPEEVILPVVVNLHGAKLKTIRMREGLDFKRDGNPPALQGDVPDALRRHPLSLDWYPRIQAAASREVRSAADVAEKHEGKLTARHLAFLDWDALFFEIERFKAERAWYNLELPRDSLRALLQRADWYRLLIPPQMLEFAGFGRVRLWQEIAGALLKKYAERLYTYRKQEWEAPHLELRTLDASDPNLIDEYRFLVDRSQESLLAKLEELKEAIASGALDDVEASSFRAICWDRHLYQPLVYLSSESVEVRPVPLNKGERDFVLDLRAFHQKNPGFFADKELYLLRNQSRGRGIGFFEAGNFYPDFILWLLAGTTQYVTFVDPKGLRNLEGPDDPKIRFHQTIKELEARLRDPQVVLNSVIISQTPHQQVGWWDGGMTEAEFETRHVFFRDGNGDLNMPQLFRRTAEAESSPAR
jgi:hypothetical protein